MLSLYANRYAGFWTRVPCSDLTGGFNCIHSDLLKSLPPLRSDGYAFQIELKFLSHRKGSVFGEVPIQFTSRLQGESKLSRSHILEGLWRPVALRFGWKSAR
jgi:dolichol-phosphate mannosyltransferase